MQPQSPQPHTATHCPKTPFLLPLLRLGTAPGWVTDVPQCGHPPLRPASQWAPGCCPSRRCSGAGEKGEGGVNGDREECDGGGWDSLALSHRAAAPWGQGTEDTSPRGQGDEEGGWPGVPPSREPTSFISNSLLGGGGTAQLAQLSINTALPPGEGGGGSELLPAA